MSLTGSESLSEKQPPESFMDVVDSDTGGGAASMSGGGRQPPELPVKQHRSGQSSRSSGVLSDDVFAELTDCHAAQCPVHQPHGHSQHQLRFFSDGTPPPVPKKRLARALSLPGASEPPLAPLSPMQKRSLNFDNPLYMMAPSIRFFKEAEELEEVRGVRVPPLSQLSFDTPDQQLSFVLGGFNDHRDVSIGIQQCQLHFLRRMVENVRAGVLLQGHATWKDVSFFQLQDFQLSEDSEPKRIGDSVFYSLHCPKLPGRVLALRIHKQTADSPTVHSNLQQPHVNVQHVIASFPDPPPDADAAAKHPGGGSSGCVGDPVKVGLSTLQSFLRGGRAVSVERDLPLASLADFVEENVSPWSTECWLYDRRVCLLLLQILIGSQHLYHICNSAAELHPRSIFLVWPNRKTEEVENPEGSKTRPTEGRETLNQEVTSRSTNPCGRIQTIWMRQGSPRVVLTPHPIVAISVMRSHVGKLIQYCLGPQQSAPLSSAASRAESPFRRGVLHLASQLQQGDDGPQIDDMVAMLQVLLWGPCVPPWNHSTSAVNNWLAVKRASLVMELAERGLDEGRAAPDWEDFVHLHYMSSTDPETVVRVSSQLRVTADTD